MSALNSTISLDVPELVEAILWDLKAGHPVCICGPTGIGKSEILRQIAKTLGLKVVEIRLSQMTEGDMIGLPSTDGNVTRFNPPAWYKEACDEPCLLFFDERDRGVHEVSQAIMQIADSFALNGFPLHPDTRIVSAINGGSHATSNNYNTTPGDPAENDRWVTYEFNPSPESWLRYAISQGVSDEIVRFISHNSSNLEHIGVMEPGIVYPSRRSWFRLDKKLKVNDLISKFYNKELSAGSLIANCASYVGGAAAQQFVNFISQNVVVTANHVLNGQHQNLWEDLSATQILAIIREMGEKKLISLDALSANYDSCENKGSSHVANLNRFAVMLDGEHLQSLIDSLEVSEPDDQKRASVVELMYEHPYNGTTILHRALHFTNLANTNSGNKT